MSERISIEQRFAQYGGGRLLLAPGSQPLPPSGDEKDLRLYAGLDFGRTGLEDTVNSEEVQVLKTSLSIASLDILDSVVYISPSVSLDTALRIGRVINGLSTEKLIQKPGGWRNPKNGLAIAL